VPRQAKVVVRAEHEHPFAIDDGFGAFVALQRLEEGVDVPGFRELDEVKGARLLENVTARRIVIEFG
jgi:hypothetical protein